MAQGSHKPDWTMGRAKERNLSAGTVWAKRRQGSKSSVIEFAGRFLVGQFPRGAEQR
jgi:hypothetical protein